MASKIPQLTAESRPTPIPRSRVRHSLKRSLRIRSFARSLVRQRDFESRDLSKLLARIEHDMRPGRILSGASQDSWRLLERLKQASAKDVPDVHVLELTELILNTYTDLTRFPAPPRADAAVVVGGSDDGYVGTQSVRDVGAHLAGSELRWVKGGHVSSFIMQHGSFVSAMVDSLARLANPNNR